MANFHLLASMENAQFLGVELGPMQLHAQFPGPPQSLPHPPPSFLTMVNYPNPAKSPKLLPPQSLPPLPQPIPPSGKLTSLYKLLLFVDFNLI